MVDQSRFIEAITDAAPSSSVLFPVSANTNVTAQLVVKNIEDMAAKAMILTIQTGSAYNLDTAAIDIAKITAALGTTDTENIPAIVTTRNSDAVVNGANVIVSPVEFTITCTYNNETVNVDTFNAFVSRWRDYSYPSGSSHHGSCHHRRWLPSCRPK